ncbi:hypothetical protein NSP77_26185, partial [Salmonella enterica]|nr:hypothetical protein [Salmonella enterica]
KHQHQNDEEDEGQGIENIDNTHHDIVGTPAEIAGNSTVTDAYRLGLGEPCPISAEHGQGLPDLRDAIVEAIGKEKAFAEEKAEEEFTQ